jgi:hypothetical protein
VIEEPNRLLKLEIKSAATISEDFFSGFQYWKKITRNDNKNAYLIYNGSENQHRTLADVVKWDEVLCIFKKVVS